MQNIRTSTWAARALIVALLLVGGCWSTGNPGDVFENDGSGEGGGEGGGEGTELKEPGDITAPITGQLVIDGRPILETVVPASGSTGVDIRTPVMLWFNESIHTGSVSSTSVGGNPASVNLRVKDSLVSVPYDMESFCGDRLIALTPKNALAPDTMYEVSLNQELRDLRGERFHSADDKIVATFTTDAVGQLTAPRVMGSFPPDGSTHQPNDHSLVVVLSSPVRRTPVSNAVTVVNLDTGAEADFVTNGFADDFFAGDRILRFKHENNQSSDLGATLRLDIDQTMVSAGGLGEPLSEAYSAEWSTLEIVPPSSLTTNPVTLASMANYEVSVAWGDAFLPGDLVHAELQETFGQNYFAQQVEPIAQDVFFEFFLEDPELGGAIMGDGSLTLATFAEREGHRTTVLADSTLSQDTQRPSFSYYGPPTDEWGFVTDLPEFRVYGYGNEPLSVASVDFETTSKSHSFTYDSNFFVGPAFEDPFAGGPIHDERMSFTTTLTDAVGNEMVTPKPGYVTFRGFVGGQTLAEAGNILRVIAFNSESLEPIAGVDVVVDGLGVTSSTGSDGSVEFQIPPEWSSVTVTLQRDDSYYDGPYHAVSVMGVDASVLSVPMRLVNRSSQMVSAQTYHSNGALVQDGESRVFASLAVGSSERNSPATSNDDGEYDYYSGILHDFATAGLTGGFVEIRNTRPGWWSAFYGTAAAEDWASFAVSPELLTPAVVGKPESPYFGLADASANRLELSEGVFSGNPLLGLQGNAYVAASTVVPGLDGRAYVGYGKLDTASDPDSFDLFSEPILVAAVEGLGAASDSWDVGFYGEYSSRSFWTRTIVESLHTSASVEVVIPDVLESGIGSNDVGIQIIGGFHLPPGDGWYRIKLEDLSDPFLDSQWDIYAPSSLAPTGQIVFPTVDGEIPLPDPSNWRVRLDAYSMPVGFDDNGFFFSSLRRDCLFWVGSDWN